MRLFAAISVTILLLANQARGFALLGPYEDWMQPTNGYQDRLSYNLYPVIGGPMDLNAEYRWNVPIVTYAFDASFVNYFGSNGVAAVERAIQMLNGLPPASGIVLTNYPFDSSHINPVAQIDFSYDLTSVTLGLLLEQLGLNMPVQSIFNLKNFDRNLFTPFCRAEACWYPWAYPDYIVERNYDPETRQSEHWVNSALYTATIYDLGSKVSLIPFQVDPTAIVYTAVADQAYTSGQYYSGLTYDDVGGLRYLYGTNNINFEILLPDVHAAASNTNSHVNGAWRPGVDKVTFVRQEANLSSDGWSPMTNQFDDIFVTNNLVITQRLERVTTQPDFLFSASDYDEDHSLGVVIERSGTTNWLNLAAGNGQASQAGPGLIRPPGKIKFRRIGPLSYLNDTSTSPPNTTFYWPFSYGSYDVTNVPIVFPSIESTPPDHFNVTLYRYTSEAGTKMAKWRLNIPYGGTAALQISSNLTAWTSVGQITNLGTEITWVDDRVRQAQFYRIVPQ